MDHSPGTVSSHPRKPPYLWLLWSVTMVFHLTFMLLAAFWWGQEFVSHRETWRGPWIREHGAELVLVAFGAFGVLGFGINLHWLRQIRRLSRERETAMAALEQEHRLYKSLMDALPVKLYRTDTQSRILFMNKASLDEVGKSLEYCLGKSVMDFYLAELAEKYLADDARVVRGETLHLTEEHISPVTGQLEIVEVIKGPITDPEGRVIGTQGVYWEVTAQKRLEEELKRSEFKYRRLFESLTDACATVDMDGRILEFNEAFRRMCGYDANEIHALSYLDLTPEQWHAFEKSILETQVIPRGYSDYYEKEYRRKDGSVFPVELKTFLLRDDQGNPTGMWAILRDITKRKQAEAALRDSEEKFRLLVQNLRAAVIVYDGDGVIQFCNPMARDVLGVSEQQPVGRALMNPTWQVFREDGSPMSREEDPIQRVIASGRPVQDLILGVRSPQTESLTWLLVSANPLFNAQGTVTRVIVILMDLTQQRKAEAERKQMEEAIQHAQKLESLGSLAGGIAHDMNNVLAAILGLASALQPKYASDESLCRSLGTIEHAAVRGRDLVKGLTEFARKGLQKSTELDINEFVRKEIDLLRHTTLQRYDLILDLQENLPCILGDPSTLGGALMNLCVNAMDAMPMGGILIIRTERLGQSAVVLTVEDTGEGMTPEVKAKAVEPFFTTKPTGKGTGLGLAMVYGTMKAHGGSMEIESTPGKGTRVRLQLPGVVASPIAVADGLEATDPKSKASQRILLVDDDELIRSTAPLMLEIGGHEVDTASSGVEALRRIRDGLDVDLVILDLNMPGMSGTETLAQLRPLRPDLPVLIATGFLDDATSLLIAQYPKVSLLMKPYALADILQKVQQVTGS